MSRAITIDEIKSRLFLKYGDVVSIVDETYERVTKKCTFIDKDYGPWEALPCNVIKKTGHPKRGELIKRTKQTASLDEVERRIFEIHGDVIAIVPSTYTKIAAKATFIDKDYGEWDARVCDVLDGNGHKKRANDSLILSLSEVKQKLYEKHGDNVCIVDSTYAMVKQYATFIDKDYGEWKARVYAVLNGHGHRERGIKKNTESRITAPKEQSVGTLFPHLLDEWNDSRNPFSIYPYSSLAISWKCKKCTRTWESILSSRVIGHGCSFCCNSFTKLEKFIEEKLNIKKYNQRIHVTGNNWYKPDFKLNENLFLNSDGLYWHNEEKLSKNYHFKLREDFENIGKRILQFYDDQIYNQWPIIESVVNNAIGDIHNKIMARKCEFKEVFRQEMFEFFTKNHLMGNHGRAKCIGLYYENELVSALSYTVHKEGYIKIERFSSKLNTVVVGGFQKLLKLLENAAKHNGIKQIISFCDLRYATGKSYEKAGFKRVGITLGFYWTDHKQRFNRLKCKAGNGKTQAQNAAEKGWLKIYDAGQAKYVKTLI